MEPSRNQMCPCGSGRKYKRCCLGKGLVADARAESDTALGVGSGHLPPGARVVEHRGRQLVTTGDLDEKSMDMAVEYFDAKERGEGPAAAMMRFAEPLLEKAGDDPRSYENAMSLGMFIWNLAICRDEDAREDLIRTLLGSLPDGMLERDFRSLAGEMIERHQRMFPGMHGMHAR